jgi:hypothetical protein
LARTQWTKYYLNNKADENASSGSINTYQPSENDSPDVFHNISLNTVLIASYGLNVDLRSLGGVGQRKYLTYTTQPLKDDLRVWGPVSITLYAAAAEEVTSDWSFFVKMGEMVPEGVPLNPITGNPEIKPEVNDVIREE